VKKKTSGDSRLYWAFLPVAAFAVTTITTPSRAQDTTAKAQADVLFDEARKLMGDGRYGDACPKLAESNRLDPAVGTLLYLGDCYEKSGRLASAWTTFREGREAARVRGQADREKAASERVAAIEPRLSRLRIVIPSASDVPGLAVRRDGAPIERPLWGTAFPLDAGRHVVEATATGRQPWRHEIEVGPAAATVELIVPTLESSPATPPATPPATSAPVSAASTDRPPQTTPTPGMSPVRTAGLIGAGVGVVLIGTGVFFGLQAKSKDSDADGLCQGNRCGSAGFSTANDAKSAAKTANIMLVLGGALTTAGVAAIVLSGNADAREAWLAPLASPSTAGVAAGGTF
jgi:serine/threonine-protein kinase